MTIQELKILLAHYGLSPEKSKGQHFLCHEATLVRMEPYLQHHTIVEIGPGPGGLTEWLHPHTPDKLTLIEMDERMRPLLEERFPKAIKIFQDVLTVNWDNFAGALIVSNLPYNVSVPIFLKFVAMAPLFHGGLFMFQKEVAQRIMAQPRTKHYGRLAVMAQSYVTVTPVAHVSPGAFWPQPKVDSMVVYCRAHQEIDNNSSMERTERAPFEALERVVMQAFHARRKMIHHAFQQDFWHALGINRTQRPEELTIQDFHTITHYLLSQKK